MDLPIEDPGPIRPVSGRAIEMHLEEHHYRKRFFAIIVGPVLVASEPIYDGMYLLKLDPNTAEKLSVDHILFLPHGMSFAEAFLTE